MAGCCRGTGKPRGPAHSWWRHSQCRQVTSCLGWSSWNDPGKEEPMEGALGLGERGLQFHQTVGEPADFQGQLTGSSSRCQGQLEVHLQGSWSTVCSQSWGRSPSRWEDPHQVSNICRRLGCREAVILAPFSRLNTPRNQLICHGHLGTFSNCTVGPDQCPPLSLVCLEPQTTTPPPTSPPPTTTPEPTASPRLRLVPRPGDLHCTGVVEFYSGGQGGTVSYEGQSEARGLGNLLCEALQCGSFLKHLPGSKAAGAQDLGEAGGHRPLPIRWEIQNASCASVEQCFRKIQPQKQGAALTLACSDFQPKVQSRLAGGSSMCEGVVEVRHGGEQWASLCDSSPAKVTARWKEVCREQQCGSVKSYHVLDAGKTPRGLSCPKEILSQCLELQEEKSHCKKVFVTCQDPSPAGLNAGSVASIVLGLVLLAVLLVLCGPPAYKKLVKKFRQKKQRQWIGPTAVNQNMSFHRSHTATVRSQAEAPTASHVDNEYSQPPRNSLASAYPALEGALHRTCTQPDNSSDSDYDLHGAQRL
ncbi:T-cell surface glycoprotein CD5 [Carlito syrichta]|uniref:T-cell surface glycoprotein CD5 n=1 Tax=Carlito syrichta TaxID=1868482 RepID=A0A3Q0DMA0_CARSF|nr:T-cell surface glycoprotein CD5 [Carlito syrichta]